ncbi:NDR1/HIN1-like protein 3 [Asparagus officinalis]|uniref:NDR1/HIN1-like protein 3 n=1 Tax=Asparagus officinalis TaxID=4686 RepID=UPI00098E52D4|nr:NDR1/HIN1-like protein 3 [Asparagus officinalis]
MVISNYHRNPNPNGYYPNASPQDQRDLVIYIYMILVAFVIAGFITLVVYGSYHPNFPELSISRFQVSGFNLSSNNLSCDFNVSVVIRNPNKKWGVRYDEIRTAVLYSTGDVGESVLNANDFVIASTSMFPFSQRPRNVTDLKAVLGTAGLFADEGRIRWGDGDLRFGVRVSSAVRFRMGAWKTPTYWLKVYCDDVRVGLQNSTRSWIDDGTGDGLSDFLS